MRFSLWKFHSWLGLIAGLGLIVIGLTGSVLIFHKEIEVALNPAIIRVEPAPAGRLPLVQLVAAANTALPDYEIAGWILDHDPHQADQFYARKHGAPEWLVAVINPYNGTLLASPREGTETFTGWMLELHYAFLADHIGMFIAGLFGVLLCVLGITGVILYREFWKTFFTFRWQRSRRILFSDIHKFVGITSVAFNLILGFTGAYWNITHVAGHWIEGEEDETPAPAERLYTATLPFDTLIADAAKRIDGFETNYIDFPVTEGFPLTLYGAVPGGFLRGPYGSTVSYDAHTGAFKELSDLRQGTAWARITDAFTPLHYGTFGGLPVKILWTLGGLTPGVLAISGFLMWWARRPKKRRTETVV